MTILLGNGSGGFTAALGSLVSVGSGPASVAVGSFNGDAFSDPAVANFNSTNVTILLNTCPVADLGVSVTDAPDPVIPDTDLTYTLTVQNLGPDAASTVTLTDPLPANTTFVSLASPGGWGCPRQPSARTARSPAPSAACRRLRPPPSRWWSTSGPASLRRVR